MAKDLIDLVTRICIAIAVCTTVVTLGSCSINKHNSVVKLVEHGVDPIAAHCAIYFGDYSAHSSLCTIVSLSEKQAAK